MKRIITSLVVVVSASLPASSAWVNVTNNLSGATSGCGEVYGLFAVPGQNKIIALNSNNTGLFATTDNGGSWQPLGSSTGWVDPQYLLFDKSYSDTFWECGIHGGQIHKTVDGGKTFTALSGASSGDGIGVDLTDPLRQTIVSGDHEGQTVTKSTDGGKTWSNITAGTSGWTQYPIVINSQTFVVGSQNAGIQRTTNGGSTWSSVSSTNVFWNPLIASTGVLYFQAMGNQAILKSTDQGVTWVSMAKAGTNDGMNYYSPVEMPDGSIVATGQGDLVQCSDGKTWAAIAGSTFPPSTSGLYRGCVCYNTVTRAFFMSFWNCGTAILNNGLWRLDYPATGVMRRDIGSAASTRLCGIRQAGLGNVFITANVAGTVSLCNPAGALVCKHQMAAGSELAIASPSSAGVYIVRFSSNDGLTIQTKALRY